MEGLQEKEWRTVPCKDVFEFQRGTENNMAALRTGGDIPLVSAKATNNGVKDFIENPSRLVRGDCLTLNNDGDGGAGLAFYQPFDMALDSHVTALIPKGNLEKEDMLFISECLSSFHGFFGHGLSISNARAEQLQIMLPINENDEPDCDFMEQYVSEKIDTLLARYKAFLEKQIEGLEFKDIPALSEKEWGVYNFTDIFVIEKGFYNKKPFSDGTGTIPFLGATDSHNGITRFLTKQEIDSNSKTGNLPNEPLNKKMFSGNSICVTNNGSVGHAYYQASEFTCSHDINPLYLKDRSLNCCLAMFLIKVIEKQGELFQYARKWRPSRMVNSKLMLPITDAGEPDWDYMEQYAKNLMLKKYQQYLEFLEGQNL